MGEYRLQLRALWLRREGRSRADVATELGKAEGWVTQVWQLGIEKVPRPRVVAKYVAAYESEMLAAGVEPFRRPSLRRAFMDNCKGLYAECAAAFPWQQAVLRKRNYDTGEVTITNIASSRQDCSFPSLRTGVPRLDAAISRVREEFHIRDPGAYLLCNWYPDGNTNIAPHQHDFWSAIISFGASRVFSLDNEPLLLNEGDLLVFGTQKHSVPRMPDVSDGRISVAIFWYPQRTKADGSFVITLDPSLAEAGLANEYLAQSIALQAAQAASQAPLDTGGRGVGRPVDDAGQIDDDDGYLSEERLVEIAMQISMLEQ